MTLRRLQDAQLLLLLGHLQTPDGRGVEGLAKLTERLYLAYVLHRSQSVQQLWRLAFHLDKLERQQSHQRIHCHKLGVENGTIVCAGSLAQGHSPAGWNLAFRVAAQVVGRRKKIPGSVLGRP